MMEEANVSRRTKESPRFLSDTLIFYEGDVFGIEYAFDLVQGNDPVNIMPEDTVRFIFRKDGRLPEEVVVEIPGTDAVENVVLLYFSPELTAKFVQGKYTYRIQYVHADGAATVAAYGAMIVE